MIGKTTTMRQILSLNNPPYMFSAWGELAVFAGYTVTLLAAGAVAFSRRDA